MNRNQLYFLTISLCLAGYVLIGYNYNTNLKVNTSSDPEFCMFKTFTGLPCPSCGTTRSVTAISHGQFLKAIWWNPLGIIMSVAMIIFPLWIARDWIVGSNSFYRFFKKFELFFRKKPVTIGFILIIIAIWAWNIYKQL